MTNFCQEKDKYKSQSLKEGIVPTKKGSIYLLRNRITIMKYTGLTKQQRPEDRIDQHKESEDDTLIGNAIREYGWENFDVCWLHYKDVEIKDLADLERHYIREYNTKHPNGYNKTDGGELGKYSKPFERRIMSYAINSRGSEVPTMKGVDEEKVLSEIERIQEQKDIGFYESRWFWEELRYDKNYAVARDDSNETPDSDFLNDKEVWVYELDDEEILQFTQYEEIQDVIENYDEEE